MVRQVVTASVRVIVFGHEPDWTSPTCVTVTTPQPSLALTDEGEGAGTSASQLTVTGAGHVMLGGVRS